MRPCLKYISKVLASYKTGKKIVIPRGARYKATTAVRFTVITACKIDLTAFFQGSPAYVRQFCASCEHGSFNYS